jgi:dUTP pyrophosphatase
MTVTVKFRKMHESAVLPAYKSDGAAGLDLVWDGGISLGGGRVPYPKGTFSRSIQIALDDLPVWLHTGVEIELPEGYEAQLRPRSSLGCRGALIPNSPGTIDSDYRGEIVVVMVHVGSASSPVLRPGDRIAQLVIAPVARVGVEQVDELSSTARGAGGFGSTGR